MTSKDTSEQPRRLDGFCSICWRKDEKLGMVLQKCVDCGALYHDACYGRGNQCDKAIVRRYATSMQCWACQSVGKTIKGRTRNGEAKTFTVTKRPTECCLCSVDLPVEIAPLAMHPLYDYHGLKGRQLFLTQKTARYPYERPAWVHSLCAFFVNTSPTLTGCVFGCQMDGSYDGMEGDEDDDDEERSVNEELVALSQQETVAGAVDGGLTEELKRAILDGVHHFVYVLEAEPWVLAIADTQKNLKCEICGSDDRNRDGNESFRLALQCCANMENEYSDFQAVHKDLHGKEECYQAMHVGCAIWGERAKTGSWPTERRIFYFPSPRDESQTEVIANMFCTAHAHDLLKAGAEGTKLLRYPGDKVTASLSPNVPKAVKSVRSPPPARMLRGLSVANARSAPMLPLRPAKRARSLSGPPRPPSGDGTASRSMSKVVHNFASRANSTSRRGGGPEVAAAAQQVGAVVRKRAASLSVAQVGGTGHSTYRKPIESSLITKEALLDEMIADVRKSMEPSALGKLEQVLTARKSFWRRELNLPSAEFKDIWAKVVEGVKTPSASANTADHDRIEELAEKMLADIFKACSSVHSIESKVEIVAEKKASWESDKPADFKRLWSKVRKPIKAHLDSFRPESEESYASDPQTDPHSTDVGASSSLPAVDGKSQSESSGQEAGVIWNEELQAQYEIMRESIFAELEKLTRKEKKALESKLVGLKIFWRHKKSDLDANIFGALWSEVEEAVQEEFQKKFELSVESNEQQSTEAKAGQSRTVEPSSQSMDSSGQLQHSSDHFKSAHKDHADELDGALEQNEDNVNIFYQKMLAEVKRDVKDMETGRAETISEEVWDGLETIWASRARLRFDSDAFSSLWKRVKKDVVDGRLSDPVNWSSYTDEDGLFRFEFSDWDVIEPVKRKDTE